MGKKNSKRTPPNRERGRAIAEQRRSSAAWAHKNKSHDVRHQHVVVDGVDMCLCGEDWPCA